MTLCVLADENIPAVEDLLGPGFDVLTASGREISREQLQGVDALLVRSVTRVDASLLQGTAVRFVGTATSGTDHIDTDWLQRSGVDFAFAPGSNANSVVEYVIAAIAYSGNHLERLRAGGSLGVVGYGVIGAAIVARFSALGVAAKVYDPWLPEDSVPGYAELEEVLACDVISLHPELTNQSPWPSYHLLGKDTLALLCKGQLLINVSRGPVIDNSALLERLNSLDSPTVVLDVWEDEPRISPELLSRVHIGTAHIAGYSFDGKVKATRMLCTAMANSLNFDLPATKTPESSVQEPVILPSGLSFEDGLRTLIRNCYQIERDDKLLRAATLDQGPDAQAAQFDLLRKNYARRAELRGQRVLVQNANTAELELVSALGCVPVQSEG
ncbi:MAG: 4-phosphoerythronate dehydrogenase [Halioglobus sp.]